MVAVFAWALVVFDGLLLVCFVMAFFCIIFVDDHTLIRIDGCRKSNLCEIAAYFGISVSV